MMNKMNFKNPAARKIFEDYLQRIRFGVKTLSPDEQDEILMEYTSHIYEGISRNNADDEVMALLSVTEKLGNPEEFLKPLVARKKLEQAVRTFNPRTVLQALLLNIRSGVVFSIFGLLYLSLFSFLFLILSKILFPTQTGLFYMSNEFRGFGFIRHASMYHEVLGYWLIPFAALGSILLYIIITLFLRMTTRK